MRTKFQYGWRSAALGGALSLCFGFGFPPLAAEEQDQFAISVGGIDLVRYPEESGDVGIDYRMPRFRAWRLKPWVGLMSTSDKALWGGAGLYYDWALGSRTRVTPSFGAGFYEEGVDVDLGHAVEFRSQLEVSYRFDSQARVGVNFGHLSNAGLADSNKGTEYFNLSYTLPLGRKRPAPPVNAEKAAGKVVAARGPE